MLNQILLQVQFLGSILVLMALVLGLGGLLLWTRLNQFSISIYGAFGLLLTGLFSLFANFFIPLNIVFFILLASFSVLGWVKLRSFITRNELLLLLGFTILYWILGLRAAPNADASLYHIPIMHWMHESALPIGLANVHGRFATWNFWFSVCGGLSAGNVIPHAFLTVNIILVVFAFLDFYQFSSQSKKLRNSFFCIAILLLYSMVDFRTFSLGQKSPNADFAGGIIAIWCASYFLLRKEIADWRFPVVLLSGFAILLKLNQAPLGILILYVLWESKLFKNRSVVLGTSVVAVGALLMIVKTFWTSGCLVFPVKATCSLVPWRVSDVEIDGNVYWIMRWARNPGDALAGQFNYWGWVKRWFELHLDVKLFFSTLVVIATWTVNKILFWKKSISVDRALLAVFALVLFYWFIAAPDIRFAYGAFAVIFALFLGDILAQYFSDYRKVLLWGVGVSFLISAIGQVRRADDFGANALIIRKPVLITNYNTSGQPFFVPEGNECNEAPVPCTPYFDPTVIQSKRGMWISFEKKL